MSRRPTRQAFTLAGIGALLVAVGATAQAGWLFVLAAGVLGTLVASAALARGLGHCELERSLPARARVGEEVTVSLAVTNTARRRALPPLRIEDRHPALEPAAAFCERVGAGRRATAKQARHAVRRGSFRGGGALLTSAWPFGALAASRNLEVASPIVVVPEWVPLRRFPLGVPASPSAGGAPEPAPAAAGQEFASVRDYRAGDDLRKVHWRSTARRGRLVVREDSPEATQRVAIVLAGADFGVPPDSAFEALVSAAASIALYAKARGRRVELLRSGPGGKAERLDDPGEAQLLAWLARAEPLDVALGPLAADAAAGGGSVVLCAPSAGRAGAELPEAIQRVERSGARAIAVVADARSWTTEGGPLSGAAEPLRLSARAPRVLRRGEELKACLEA